MATINFTKMHGLGNDYVYINDIDGKISDERNLSIKISDRHFGIGSDGLILIRKSDVADFKMSMYNADGSEAQMCGNGIRCVAKYVYDNKLSYKKTLTIETLAGVKTLELNIGSNDLVKEVTVDMGEPILEAKSIPVNSKKDDFIAQIISILDKDFKVTAVSMGNPHAVIFVNDVINFNVEKYGKALEQNTKLFREKTNVEFIEIIDGNNLKMRVWERGSGETLACGTGACASVVAGVLNGVCNKKCQVHLLGGTLKINWDDVTNHVFLTGSATKVFDGNIKI